MGLRFRKSLKIASGVKLNIGKKVLELAQGTNTEVFLLIQKTVQKLEHQPLALDFLILKKFQRKRLRKIIQLANTKNLI